MENLHGMQTKSHDNINEIQIENEKQSPIIDTKKANETSEVDVTSTINETREDNEIISQSLIISSSLPDETASNVENRDNKVRPQRETESEETRSKVEVEKEREEEDQRGKEQNRTHMSSEMPSINEIISDDNTSSNSNSDSNSKSDSDINSNTDNSNQMTEKIKRNRGEKRMTCSLDFLRDSILDDLRREYEDQGIDEIGKEEGELHSPGSLCLIPKQDNLPLSPTSHARSQQARFNHKPNVSFNLINERGKQLKIVTDIDQESETMIIMDVRKSGTNLERKQKEIMTPASSSSNNDNDDNNLTSQSHDIYDHDDHQQNNLDPEKGKRFSSFRQSFSRLYSGSSHSPIRRKNNSNSGVSEEDELIVTIDERHKNDDINQKLHPLSPLSASVVSGGSSSSPRNQKYIRNFDNFNSSGDNSNNNLTPSEIERGRAPSDISSQASTTDESSIDSNSASSTNQKDNNNNDVTDVKFSTTHTPLHPHNQNLNKSNISNLKRNSYRNSFSLDSKLSNRSRREKEEEETRAYREYNHFAEYSIHAPNFYTSPSDNEEQQGIELSPKSRSSSPSLSLSRNQNQNANKTQLPDHQSHQTINSLSNFPLLHHVMDYVGSKKTDKKNYYRAGMSSQNYENDESEVARLYALNKYGDTLDEKEISRRTRIRSIARWTLLAIIGIIIDLLYMFITVSSQGLLLLKETVVNNFDSPLSKYVVYLAFSLLYSSLAFLCVYFAPLAVGSGIPETNAFLNGIRIPYMHSLPTLVGKVLGTIFSVASGLPVGKYGPMIHIGSIVAANISKLARSTLAFGQFFETLRAFSSHAEKRDLVVAGTAAGVTSAFNAPVGGLLLAWEESSSYWNLKVSWRVFFTTMTAVVFTFFVTNAFEYDHNSKWRFLNIDFLNTSITDTLQVSTKSVDFFFILVLGIAGGLLGASYVEAHKFLSRQRDKMLKYRYCFQYFQVIFVSLIVTSVSVFSAWGSQSWSCKPLPNVTSEDADNDLSGDLAEIYQTQHLLLRYTCPEGTYNEVASLSLNAGADTLKLLYHMPAFNPASEDELMFSSHALFAVAIPYFFLLLLTFGIAIPSGFFVPQLVAGGLLGRLLITYVSYSSSTWMNTNTTHSKLQVYALMGSAAFIGGVSRMVLSMTLMLVEATASMQLLVPFAIILIITRWVGNLFNSGIFETIIAMKGYPVLKADPPKWALRHGRAGDLASRKLVTLHPIESSERLVEVLTETTHHLFPIVYPPGHVNEGLCYGTVMREVLIIILKTHSLSKNGNVNTSPENPDIVSPVISFTAQQKFEGQLSTEEMERPKFTLGMAAKGLYADLRPYVNRSLYLVNRSASLSKVYNLFRGVGLRHLLVVDEFHQNKLHGVLTRHDLIPENIRKVYINEYEEKLAHLNSKDDDNYDDNDDSPSSTSTKVIGSFNFDRTRTSTTSKRKDAKDTHEKENSPYWTLPSGIRNKLYTRERSRQQSQSSILRFSVSDHEKEEEEGEVSSMEEGQGNKSNDKAV